MTTTTNKIGTLSVVAATDSYTWSNQYGGIWATGPNWYDTTIGSPVITAPSAASMVGITGGIGDNFTNILGTGAAAQLSITGDVIIWGTVAVGGTLALLAPSAANLSTELALDGGASVVAANLNMGNGTTLEVGNASKLTVSGTAALTAAFLMATDASNIQFGVLIANASVGVDGPVYGTIFVDDSASLEIGTTGGAATGAITIDNGMSAAVSGMIVANVVLNGTLSVQAGASLYIDIANPFGTGQSIRGSGTLVISENSQLTLGVADSAAISFGGPKGKLVLYALPSGTISGFVAGDTIVLIGLATGLRYTQTTANVATLTLTKGATVIGTLTMTGNYAGNLFHIRIDSHGNDFITVQSVGVAPVQPTLIVGTAGSDSMIATANNQTLTGLGGTDSLNGSAFTGITFRDTSANLNGCTITSFSGYDVIDLTNMNPGSVSATSTPAVYSPGLPAVPATMTLTDGTHSATIFFSPSTPLPHGYWTVSTDGASGTNLKLTVLNTDVYAYGPPIGGSLGTVSNWLDTTTGATVTQLPGYGNAVTLAGGAVYMDISGTASVASLIASGSLLLLGSLGVGNVIPGFSGALSQTGTLALDSGASLVLAGSAAIGGTVEVGGGSKLTVAGTATFTSANTALLAINGGSMRFASVNTTTDVTFVPILYSPSIIGVDAKSSIEFGTTGNAQAGAQVGIQIGALTIDSGVTAIFSGTIAGNVVVNGTLATTNSALAIAPFGSATPSVSGSGTLQIASGGSLTLAGSDSAAIMFNPGGGATLALAGTLPTGTISGFAKGDAIGVALLVTAVKYAQTGSNTGRLSLLNGTAIIGTLTFAGIYAAQQFHVHFAASTQSSTITYSATPSTAAGNQINTGSDGYGWTNTSGGSWTSASNWTSTTSGAAANTAPGAGNTVVIQNNPGSWTSQIISGSGSATSLAMYGSASTVFTGNISISKQFYLGGGISGGVALERNAQFSVGSLSDYSSLQVAGGAALTVTGLSGGTEIVGSLSVVGGGAVRATGSFDIGGGIVGVDATSVLECGTAGGAATGGLTIDTGQVVTLQENGVIAAILTVNGTLVVSKGTIEGFGGATGSIRGTGTIQIGGILGAGTLTLNAADNAALLFFQTNQAGVPAGYGTLEIRGPIPAGQISGFVAGNTIQIDQTITGVSFKQVTTARATLTLMNGVAIVGTLTFMGSFTSSLFQLDVAAASGVATISLQTATTSAGTAAASTGADAYRWTGASGGSWSNAANWMDTTTAASPSKVAGRGNAVTIAAGVGQYTTIGGNGAAASLAIGGNVLLTGQIAAAGQLSIAPASGQPATLALNMGAQLTAGSAVITGILEVNGSSATIAGNASLVNGTLLALNGGFVQASGLIGGGSNVIAIDSSSVVTIGTTANPIKGALTQAAGTTAVLSGSIYGNIVTNGALAVAGGGSLFIDMTGAAASDPYSNTPTIGGTGTLSITEGSTLGLGAVASSIIIQFAGPNGTLVLAALPTGLIRGFVAGDTIQLDRAVTGLSFAQITANQATLTLTNGGATVGLLRLAGNYSNAANLFHLDAAANGATATITLQTLGIAATQPTLIQGTMAADLLTATANGQTLTGLGGGDTLNGGGFTAITFKDLAANMNGDAVQGFVASDCFDFTDMNSVRATAMYANGNLSVTDGTHTASFGIGFAGVPTTGAFHVASDGAAGTKLTWS